MKKMTFAVLAGFAAAGFVAPEGLPDQARHRLPKHPREWLAGCYRPFMDWVAKNCKIRP